jgi:hypothetical protein
MSETFAPSPPERYTPPIDPEAVTRALMAVDLAKLSAVDRVQFYAALCRSTGLNVLTRPFIVLRGQDGTLAWYITAAGCEQLRRLHRVSTRIMSRERTDDGLYLVTVQCRTPDERVEEAQGVVVLQGLKPPEMAQALMRCETKAKRRATLALLGLGLSGMDEEAGSPVAFDPHTGTLEEPETAPQRQTAGALLTTIGAWFRQRPRASREVLAQTVWGVTLAELPHLSLDDLQAGWFRLDEGRAPLDWASATLDADLRQWLARHAQQAMLDVFGEDPAEATEA